MRPDPKFSNTDRAFWAHVKLISEKIGYSFRGKKGLASDLRTYTFNNITSCLTGEGLHTNHIVDDTGAPTPYGQLLLDYLNRRRELLVQLAEPNLMSREQAKTAFETLKAKLNPNCTLPLNKQRGEKKHPAYLVGIVNMLTEQALNTRAFCDNPHGLCVITRGGFPIRTFSRRMDGAYPSIVNPIAIWEIKEYYGTKTFGSRVADGVHETMLDGEEVAELAKYAGKRVFHYLIVDDYQTWWNRGRSFLCRIVDMLHSGLVDEVLFGREVISRWPQIVATWPPARLCDAPPFSRATSHDV